MLTVTYADQVAAAIRDMVVRGAAGIGYAAANGIGYWRLGRVAQSDRLAAGAAA